MATTTRKTTPAKKTTTPRKAAPKAAPVAEETTVSETVENVETEAVVESAPKKKGPKPNPFTRVERAKKRADKARAAHAKVQKVVDDLAEAEAEEQAALAALQEAVAAAGVSTES